MNIVRFALCVAGFSFIVVSARAAQPASSSGSDDFSIGPSAKLKVDQPLDVARVAEFCKTLTSTSASERDRAIALAALKKDRTKSAEFLAANLSPKVATETDTRLGALKGIEAVKPVEQRTSLALAAAATTDPIVEVRKAATALVKSRDDHLAIQGMLGNLVAAHDAAGNIRNKILAANAADALRDLGDKRVYQAIFYHVWMELRLTNISAGNLATRQIDTYSVQNNGQFPFPVQLALPIQTPELSIEKVRTTVVAPALGALKTLSGQDFGDDVDKWGKWIDKQK